MNAELKRRAKVAQAFPSTDSVMRLLGAIVGEAESDWATGRVFMSPESLEPVLGLKRAENAAADIEVSKEAEESARVIVMVALDEFDKAA